LVCSWFVFEFSKANLREFFYFDVTKSKKESPFFLKINKFFGKKFKNL